MTIKLFVKKMQKKQKNKYFNATEFCTMLEKASGFYMMIKYTFRRFESITINYYCHNKC